MKKTFRIFVLCFYVTGAYAQVVEDRVYQLGSSGYYPQPVGVKKKRDGKVCDSCNVPFFFSGNPDFSYVLAGTPQMPGRLYSKTARLRRIARDGITSVVLTPYPAVSVFLLPNYRVSNGDTVGMFRNYKGLDYRFCEYQVLLNNQVVVDWTAMARAKNSDDYAIFQQEQKQQRAKTAAPWDGAVFAGDFQLKLADSLIILVKDKALNEILHGIFIQRIPDKATDFQYVQLPKLTDLHDNSLQNFLNANIETQRAKADSRAQVFEKDDDKIGIFSFNAEPDDVLEFSFDNGRQWETIKPGNFINSRGRIYLVADRNIAAGESRDLYLRYRHQPETVHKVTIKAKPQKQIIPWATTAMASTGLLLLIAGGSYARNRRQKRRLAALNAKSRDIEARLALLSGQLNPHFLFNSLHAIQGTINSNNITEANRYIDSVARFMRSIMDQGQKEFISLAEELALEKDYLQLEQKRKNFTLEIDTDSQLDLSQIDFPPLLLQPVLENSVRHAFGQKETSVLKISILSVNTDLVIVISDNGAGWNRRERGSGHGLGLVEKRIRLINEKLPHMQINMKIESVEDAGVTTIFTLQNWLS